MNKRQFIMIYDKQSCKTIAIEVSHNQYIALTVIVNRQPISNYEIAKLVWPHKYNGHNSNEQARSAILASKLLIGKLRKLGLVEITSRKYLCGEQDTYRVIIKPNLTIEFPS